ncbi:alpha/beta fold hydrolase [Promicromonospora citrea]|uniref:Alpha/beta hydrolase n=1 Tax=Promicromonospora citrea TaxID=43677 RepID=A0A8H9GQ07_9MICO|nr:alpha/beta hydrolase [Promicromonospora citrea]GGM44455.1 alpha/beta hydrolase [Promicromonospora citrea]
MTTSRHPVPRLHRWYARRRAAVTMLTGLLALGSLAAIPGAAARPGHDGHDPRPTIVLVHGAWADASSWAGVVRRLQAEGYPVVAPANPLRSLASDSAYLATFLETVDGPTVLVGHSYGAAVATNAAVGNPDVRALVFVNGSVPARGETVAELAGPDSALSVPDPTTIFDFAPSTLPPEPGTDVYLKPSTFLRSFATGLRNADAEVLSATQRPITFGALNEPSAEPAWRSVPSWYLVGTKDRVIPRSAQEAMARKAGSSVTRYDAGHLGPVTHPAQVARVITAAVRATR